MHPVTESVATAPKPQVRLWFSVLFVSAVVLANLIAVGIAWHDNGWSALWIAIIGGPILNGMFLLAGLVAMPFLRRRHSQLFVSIFLVVTLGLPIVAIAIDLVVILSMNLHGC